MTPTPESRAEAIARAMWDADMGDGDPLGVLLYQSDYVPLGKDREEITKNGVAFCLGIIPQLIAVDPLTAAYERLNEDCVDLVAAYRSFKADAERLDAEKQCQAAQLADAVNLLQLAYPSPCNDDILKQFFDGRRDLLARIGAGGGNG